MNRMQQQVLEFHQKFGAHIAERVSVCPDPELTNFRANLIEEEAAEFRDAADLGDVVGMADAIGDILYVTFGAAIALGIDCEPLVDEIHRSNMTKVWPDGSVRRREDGKVMKPPTYSPANIVDLIAKQLDPIIPKEEPVVTV